jgi:hypothetical protein
VQGIGAAIDDLVKKKVALLHGFVTEIEDEY